MKNLKKKAVSLLLTICVLVSLSVCVYAADENEFSIKIVHTNDIHARVEENEGSKIIGAEKLGNIIYNYTHSAENTPDIDLVLDSGDLFHGQPIATLDKGESMAKLINACGYDAMTAGNHDWSYGKDRLKELCEKAGMLMLTGNVINDSTAKGFFQDDTYVETASINGRELKVGVFGVIDPQIKKSTTPSNVEGLTFTNSAEYANKAAAQLKAADCDIVIALTHTNKPAELAQKVSGVDLWLAGHEHIQINEEVTDAKGKTTRVVESGYYLQSLSLIEISGTLDENGAAESINITVEPKNYDDVSSFEKNQSISSIMEQIKSAQSEQLTQKVGYTPETLNGTWEDLRINQQNLGNVITDAYLLETGADVAFENAGGIRASIDRGDVTYGDIIGVSPYGNYVVTKQVSGAQLKEIMETTFKIQSSCRAANDSGIYDAWPQSSGSYLQFGGMTVVYNSDAENGQRVKSILVQDKPLDETKMYTVATNNYVEVSDTYPSLKNAEEIGQFRACDEILVSYFQHNEEVLKSVYSKRLYDNKNDKAFIMMNSLTSLLVYTPIEQNADFIIAEYNDEEIPVNLKIYNEQLNKGLNTVDIQFDITSASGGCIKVFMWNSLEKMQPLAKCIEMR